MDSGDRKKLEAFGKRLITLQDSALKNLDDGNKELTEENILLQIKSIMQDVLTLIEGKEIDFEESLAISSIVSALDSFQTIDVKYGTSIFQNIVTNIVTTQEIKKLNKDFDIYYLAYDESYWKNFYKKTKEQLSSQFRIKILRSFDFEKEFIEEELKDKSLQLTPADRMELIGECHSFELAKEYSNTDEFKQYMKEYDCYNSVMPPTADFIITLYNNNPLSIMRFAKKHPNYEFKEDLVDFFEKRFPKYFKLKNEGKNTIKKGKKLILMHRAPSHDVIFQISRLGDDALREYYLKHKEYMDYLQKRFLLNCFSDFEKRKKFVQSLAELGEDYFDIADDFIYDRIKICKDIDSFFDVSIDELENNPQIKYYSIGHDEDFHGVYSTKEMIEMHKAYKELFGDIPKAEQGNPKSEYEVFQMVFDRIKEKIKYDTYSTTPIGERNNKLLRERSTLYGALVKKKCVCSGNSRLLSLVLNDKNVQCNSIIGFLRSKLTNKIIIKSYKLPKEDENDYDYHAIESFHDAEEVKSFIGRRFVESGGHAWNQITIGGVRFNCDITNFNNSKKALMSDKEFKLLGVRYYRGKGEFSYHESLCCNTSFREAFPDLAEERDIISLKNIRNVLEKRKKQINET